MAVTWRGTFLSHHWDHCTSWGAAQLLGKPEPQVRAGPYSETARLHQGHHRGGGPGMCLRAVAMAVALAVASGGRGGGRLSSVAVVQWFVASFTEDLLLTLRPGSDH